MRILIVTPLLWASIACKPGAATDDEAARESPEAVQLQVYERRIAGPGEIPAPPHLLRLSGTLARKGNCLIVANRGGEHALVFEKGRATYDAAGKALRVGPARIALGDPISVGGPFNQPSEGFDPGAVNRSCGVDAVWLVTGADVRSSP